MAYPKSDRSMQLRIIADKQGTRLYGNAAAFRTFARWMTWLAKSDPQEHYELHVPWHLQSPLSNSPKVKVLRSLGRKKDFEVTFMMVKAGELKELSRATPHKPKRPKAESIPRRGRSYFRNGQ